MLDISNAVHVCSFAAFTVLLELETQTTQLWVPQGLVFVWSHDVIYGWNYNLDDAELKLVFRQLA